MDCKKALAATSFDMEAAFDELRKRGLAAASKKAGRAAADGLVGCDVSACGRFAAVVEVNAETDFAAKNDVFLSLVATPPPRWWWSMSAPRHPAPGSAAEIPLAASAAPLPEAERRSPARRRRRRRENIRLRRAFVMAATGADEAIGAYVHGAVAPGMGRQAGLVKVLVADSD